MMLNYKECEIAYLTWYTIAKIHKFTIFKSVTTYLYPIVFVDIRDCFTFRRASSWAGMRTSFVHSFAKNLFILISWFIIE